jgi:hypothetical protein
LSDPEVRQIEATYHRGVLEIVLPKVEDARPRRIPIAAGGKKGRLSSRSKAKTD